AQADPKPIHRSEPPPPAHHVMRPVKDPHGSVELAEHDSCLARAGHAFEMENDGIRHVIDSPSSRLEPVAEVEVLAVHEKVFIEESDRFQGYPGEAHGRGRPGVDLTRSAGVLIGAVVAGEQPAVWK